MPSKGHYDEQLLLKRIPEIHSESIIYLILPIKNLLLVLFYESFGSGDLAYHIIRTVVFECRISGIPDYSCRSILKIERLESSFELSVDKLFDDLISGIIYALDYRCDD